jgi:hypothetical protein
MRFELLPNKAKEGKSKGKSKEGKGIMKSFQGLWTVRDAGGGASVCHLDQRLALRMKIPPPVEFLLKRICCGQIKRILADVKR